MNGKKLMRISVTTILVVFMLAIFTAGASAEDYTFVTKWGSYGIGDGEFIWPEGIAVDSSGNVFVADTVNHRIQKFDSNGNFITKWGSEGTGDGQFYGPRGVAVDSSGNVFVADTVNHRIQKFDYSGGFITKWGEWGRGNGQFYFPSGVAVDSSGNVFVAEGNDRIQKFDSNGNFITKWGSEGSGDGQFNLPRGVAVDSSGNVFVADSVIHRIQKFDSNGNFITKWGSEGSGDGEFCYPYGVAVDNGGNVFVADTGDSNWCNDRIQKFDSNGNFITKWGSEGSGDGEFIFPSGVAVDSNGYVYVVDNCRVQKFAPGAEVPPAPTVLKPNGGEEIPGGSIYDILWDVKKGTYELAANPISISYTVNSGATWHSIASGLPNDRRYSWTVPNTDTSSNCLVKVEAKDVHDNTGDDISDSTFTILQTADSTSETIPAGETETVEGPPETGTTVDVTATEDVTITIASYSENPHPEATEPATMVPKYIDISASDNDCVSWPIYVEMRYTDEEIAGLDESSLGLYYYKAGAWHRCSNTGVNAAENYVWAYVAEDECAGSPFVSGGAEAEKEPDIWIDPTSLDLTLPTNTIQDYTMMIGNDGEAALTYVISDTNTLTATAASAQFELSLETAVVALVKSHGHTVKLKPPASITYPISAIPHEISYDDGTAESGYAWTLAGSRWAVRFTPLSYPADLDIARICLRENWPDVDHETFAVEVYDDDGSGGSPGTLLGTGTTTATAWGWHDVDISGLGITVTSGDFYIAYKQLTDSPNCEGLCIDETDPQGRSWDKYDGEEWTNDPSENPGNWMIRCVVDLPEGCSWLDEIPKSGSVPPGGYDEITVTIDTTGLPEGDYSANIVIANNDPDEDPTSVPVDLTVTESKVDLVITEKWLCWPDNCTICYNVTNTGDGTAPACHNTTLYVDGVVVAHDHVPVDLAPGESYTGCFDGYTWTYTPPSDEITVCADNNEALDELDEDNNCLTNIWMCGDVNCDGKVTMSDVRKVFNRYLDPSYPLDLPWAADVNGDGKVTMSDVRKVFNRYLDPSYGLNCCCEVL